MENFDFPTGAAGFAVNVDDLVEIKLKDSNKDEAPIPEILVCAKDGFEITAIEKTKELVNQGKNAVFSVFETIEEAKQYADKTGVKELLVVGE